MRIYILELDIKKQNKSIIDNINCYKYNKSINRFYTDEGIYKYKNNDYIKYNVRDCDTEKYNTDKYTIIIDKSKLIKENDYYQIEPKHVYHSITKNIYQNKYNPIQLIIENDNYTNEIHDIYFKINDKKNSLSINEMRDYIDTFLSILNFY